MEDYSHLPEETSSVRGDNETCPTLEGGHIWTTLGWLAAVEWHLVAISASCCSTLTAWAAGLSPPPLAGSWLWETPSSYWPGGTLVGTGEPRRVSAAWGVAGWVREARTCGQESCALIWCWDWRTAGVGGLRSTAEKGRSTPHWTFWVQQRKGKQVSIFSAL